jgi:hypothetical protein
MPDKIRPNISSSKLDDSLVTQETMYNAQNNKHAFFRPLQAKHIDQ